MDRAVPAATRLARRELFDSSHKPLLADMGGNRRCGSSHRAFLISAELPIRECSTDENSVAIVLA